MELWCHRYVSTNIIVKGNDILGGAIGYAYNSFIGPLSIMLDTSNWDKNVGIYFNLGFYF